MHLHPPADVVTLASSGQGLGELKGRYPMGDKLLRTTCFANDRGSIYDAKVGTRRSFQLGDQASSQKWED